MSDIVQRLHERAAVARSEKTGTALGDAVHFEEAAAEIERLQAEVARKDAALRIFIGAAYPVAQEINRRGYNWSEAYLDAALVEARAALTPSQEPRT